MVLTQTLSSATKFSASTVQNLQLFVNRVCDALKFHLIPYLIESGLQNIAEAGEDFSPKLYFQQRFLELLLALTQTDLHLQRTFRLTSGIQDRILNNGPFLAWLQDIYQVSKAIETKRKVLQFFATLLSSFDHRQLRSERLIEILTNTVGTHKLSLLFINHSLLMLAIRTLIITSQKRLFAAPSDERSENGLSVNLRPASLQQLQKFQSSGWILRFVESRDSRVRVLAWDLITELFDYDFLQQNPSVVQTALNAYLKHQELFSVKISCLKFLLRACDCLIKNCDVFSEFEDSYQSTEQITVAGLLNMVAKQGLISSMHFILGQKDAPLLFVTLTFKFLHKIVVMDHKRALPVITQLDYWTSLIELL